MGPREVRLTTTGKVLAGVAVFMFLSAIAAYLGLSRVAATAGGGAGSAALDIDRDAGGSDPALAYRRQGRRSQNRVHVRV